MEKGIKYRRLGRAVVLICVWLLVVAAIGVPAPAMAINSVWTTTPPTIDGNFTPGEWDLTGGVTFPVTFYIDGGPSYAIYVCEMYVMNDANNLYVAILTNPLGAASANWFNFAFDNTNNGVIDGDDFIRFEGINLDDHFISSSGCSFDQIECGLSGNCCTARDTAQEGESAVGYTSPALVYEFSKPLNRGDSEDISVGPGATVGFAWIINFNGSSGNYEGVYPTDLLNAGNFGDIVIAPSGVIFYDDFESDIQGSAPGAPSIGTISLSGDSSPNQILVQAPGTGGFSSQSLMIYKNAGTTISPNIKCGAIGIDDSFYPFTSPYTSGTYTVTWKASSLQYNGDSSIMALTDDLQSDGDFFTLNHKYWLSTPSIWYIGADSLGAFDTGVSYTANVPQSFRAVFNLDTHKFDLYIDGVKVADQADSGNFEEIYYFVFAIGGADFTNTYFVDDIKIETGAIAPNADGDGILDEGDNCPSIANPGQEDSDADGIGNVCDPCPNDPFNDADADNICGDSDNCPNDANPGQADGDTDGIGDACDPCPADLNNDADNDGICYNVDNCKEIANADQLDFDGDGFGDACDNCPDLANTDGDGDGIADQCPYITPSSVNMLNETTAEMCFTNGTGAMQILNPDCCQMVFIGDDGTTIPVYSKLDIYCGPYMVQDPDQVTDYPTLPTVGDLVNIPPGQEVCVTCDLANHFYPEELGVSGGASTTVQSASTGLLKVHAYLTSDVKDPAIDSTGCTRLGGVCNDIWQGTIDFGEAELSNISVEVDIKPGNDSNDINLGSTGKLPVGILGSIFFDVSNIDPTQCSVAGSTTIIKIKGKSGESPMASYEDLNGDGIQDLLVHVETQDMSFDEGSTTADVTCSTYNGLTVTGSDAINVVKFP